MPKFELEMMFFWVKRMANLNQNRTWPIAYPFLLLTDKLGKVQKPLFLASFGRVDTPGFQIKTLFWLFK